MDYKLARKHLLAIIIRYYIIVSFKLFLLSKQDILKLEQLDLLLWSQEVKT